MSFDAIWGQDLALQTLRNALDSGRIHHAYRFEGPEGVGKERAAFALAQALVCERGSGVACDACSACRRALSFSEGEPNLPLHPDVVLVERGLYRSLLGQAEAAGISIEQVRKVVLARAALGPHEGRNLVFIVRNADELTLQAANALLKTLEEPGRNIYFILLSARPSRLIDTLRSRTLPVRFAPLPEPVLARILEKHGRDPALASLAQGSAAQALELAEPEAVRERNEFFEKMREATVHADLTAAIRFAETHKIERDAWRRLLFLFAQHLADTAKHKLAVAPEEAARGARRYQIVLTTLENVERNQAPALALESMIQGLRSA